MPTCTHAVPDQGTFDEIYIERTKEIQENFTVMLRSYIHENKLEQTILLHMIDILV